ncbi:MAG: hypothetical protein IGQ45_01295 [Cyanobacterium sp. T60_A2020_053]|nr:hypothetical protein [Cyanobacterium sp. T60_A2020_053]
MKYNSQSNSSQLSLFDNQSSYQVKTTKLKQEFTMSLDYLKKWKRNIFNYQQKSANIQVKQANLLDKDDYDLDTELINPFTLKTHTDQFYNLPQYGNSENCLYFILDTHLPILLYVGETKLSPQQRWINHDCKSYINSYIFLHRKYSLPVIIRSAFYWAVSPDRVTRQKLEKELILRWRAPFNKESWQWWGQPFK